MRNIAFVGCNSTDIVYYLSIILVCSKHSVVVIDHTSEHTCLFSATVKEQYGYIGDILFTTSDAFDKETAHHEDFGIHYFGFEYKSVDFSRYEDVFFVCNMNPLYAMRFKKFPVCDFVTKYFIVRDFIKIQFSDDYIHGCSELTIPKENRFTLNYDEFDYRLRCTMSVSRKHSLKKLSSGMKLLLEELSHRLVPELTLKDYRRIYKESGRY